MFFEIILDIGLKRPVISHDLWNDLSIDKASGELILAVGHSVEARTI